MTNKNVEIIEDLVVYKDKKVVLENKIFEVKSDIKIQPGEKLIIKNAS
jgi:hypothetical protein